MWTNVMCNFLIQNWKISVMVTASLEVPECNFWVEQRNLWSADQSAVPIALVQSKQRK